MGGEYEEGIGGYFSEMQTVLGKMPVAEIGRAIGILFSAWEKGKMVYMMGNGGSASTATHFACDLSKGTWVEGAKRFRAVSLNDNAPLISALTNDNGFDSIYVEQLRNLGIGEGDVLVAFSVHGGSGRDKAGLWSQNLLRAIDYANGIGAKTIGIAGFDGGAMKSLCSVCVVVPVDSTPHAESFHLALEHLITKLLKEKIERVAKGQG